jgi:hypothetical protein
MFRDQYASARLEINQRKSNYSYGFATNTRAGGWQPTASLGSSTRVRVDLTGVKYKRAVLSMPKLFRTPGPIGADHVEKQSR